MNTALRNLGAIQIAIDVTMTYFAMNIYAMTA